MLIHRTLLAVVLVACASAELFIQYGAEGDCLWLYQYLYSLKNQFWVDIGAYDPIKASNVFGFADWSGLYVQASTVRATPFLYSHPNHIILNMALSDRSGEIVELLNLAEDSASTVSRKAKEQFGGTNSMKITSTEKVATISMAQLCHKYYLKKPKLMSLDIQGFGQAALASNDWDRSLCVPDLIIAEDSAYNVASGLPSISEYLKEKNYIKIKDQAGLNGIFIHKSADDLLARAERGRQITDALRIIPFSSFLGEVLQLTRTGFGEYYHHMDFRLMPFYLHVARESIVSIPDLARYSEFIGNISRRPIVIVQFNPHRQKIYFGTTDIDQLPQHTSSAQWTKFIAYYSNYSLQVFIFDHEIEPQTKIEVIDHVVVPPLFVPKAEEILAKNAEMKAKNRQTTLKNQESRMRAIVELALRNSQGKKSSTVAKYDRFLLSGTAIAIVLTFLLFCYQKMQENAVDGNILPDELE